MNDNVRQLREVQLIEPDAESVAQKFESLAARVRSGDISLDRGMMVYYKADGQIGWCMLGNPLTTSQAMGMLQFGMHKMYEDTKDG